MDDIRQSVAARRVVSAALAMALGLAASGCGNDKAGEAGNASTPPTIQKANNEMENFAKSQSKKK